MAELRDGGCESRGINIPTVSDDYHALPGGSLTVQCQKTLQPWLIFVFNHLQPNWPIAVYEITIGKEGF